MRIKFFFFILVLFLLGLGGMLVYLLSGKPSLYLYVLEGLIGFILIYLIVFYNKIVKPMNTIGSGMELLREQDFSSRLSRVGQYEADRIVNEINACIPDIVFVCIPAERQMKFMEKHAAMMNTRLCILIESVQPLIRKETEEIPSWVEKLHLEGIYSWFKKEQKIKNTIVGSVFKKKVLNEASEEEAEQKPEDSSEENILDVQEENVNTLEKRRQC